MKKWYEQDAVDQSVVLSSRIRLARNVKQYPFPCKMNASQAEDVINEVNTALMQAPEEYKLVNLSQLTNGERASMIEQHVMSPLMAQSNLPAALILSDHQNISIMVTEEDHIRIQAFCAGNHIDEAWVLADEVDNTIENKVEYAFDKEFGYLTSCPTNLGTGLRASFMLHLPTLESNKQIGVIAQAIGKFGMTLRGTYGEGSEAVGSIYQISNQVTLGLSEKEILNNLKNITEQIIEQEQKLTQHILTEKPLQIEDEIYRTYGLLRNARLLSENEAYSYLSTVRFGFITGLLKEPKPKITLYQLMMDIHTANLNKQFGPVDPKDLPRIRANYVRQQFQPN